VRSPFKSAALLLSAVLLSPAPLQACACGCGVFDVGTGAMLPTKPGGFAFLEYDYLNQNQNRSGTRKASNAANEDKRLQSSFVTLGVHDMLSRSWGVMAELPFVHRYFNSEDANGNLAGAKHAGVGDVRVRGVYSGLSEDMSLGLTFGLKLPTGDYAYPGLDRDTALGTGSTDLLLGAYQMGRFGAGSPWAWYANALWDQPVLIAAGYRPGAEVNAVAGAYYEGWKPFGVTVAPLAQAVAAWRARDSGPAAKSADTGYRRLLLSPGFEAVSGRLRVNANVGFPVWEYANGDQIVAARYYQTTVGWAF
jgi:hypothetical protein